MVVLSVYPYNRDWTGIHALVITSSNGDVQRDIVDHVISAVVNTPIQKATATTVRGLMSKGNGLIISFPPGCGDGQTFPCATC